MIQPIIDPSGVIHIFKGKNAEPIKLVIGEILTAEIMDIFPSGTVQLKIDNRIINAQPQRELPLNRGDTVMVKVEKPLEDGTIPLRVLTTAESEEIKTSLINFDRELADKLLKLIDSLFLKSSTQSEQTKQSQMALLENTLSLPTEHLSESSKVDLMQKIIDLVFSRNTVTNNLLELLALIEQNNFPEEQISHLKSLIITSTDELGSEKLKEILLNSGVSFEAKMKSLLSEPVRMEQIKHDMKVVLQTIVEEAKAKGSEDIIFKAENLLKQIEGYQVLSKTYQGFFTFLPLFWQEIDGGNMAYKSLKRQGKEYHSVFITLNFKEDTLSFVTTMINKTFFISFSGKPEIVSSIRENESLLRNRFKEKGMILGSINYVNKVDELVRQWNIKEGSISVTV